MSAFSIPLSGLATSSDSLNVIANNLANLNTVGYKDETLNFADLFNQMQGESGNGDPIQVGNGVKVGSETSDFSNGNDQSTGVSSNMALTGNGFFVVENTNNQFSYTRAGDFTVNANGELATANGQLVMGYPAVNGVVSQTSALAPINVTQAGTFPAAATSSFQMTTNLDATAAVNTSTSSPITVYDSLGTPQTLTVNYTKTGSNTWSYNITIPASATGGTGNPTSVATGTLTFDSSGNLTSPSGSITGITVPGLADGASALNLTWNLNDSAGNPSITQQDTASGTSASTQNGYAAGTLTGYTILPDGTVEGQFSNNQGLALGQVAVASFANNQGLEQTGNNNFEPTYSSGNAVIGVADSGGNGLITGGAVEASNVNLSTEFANMIVAQQGYEANAKVLTTMDQLSQATLQIVS